MKETKTCTGSESADGVAADGSKEYFEDMQICVVWQSANGSVADKLEGGEIPHFIRILMIRL